MTKLGQREEGFALVTALWAALILGLLASYIVVAGRTEARISRTVLLQARLHAAAEGIVQLEKLRLLGAGASALALDGTPHSVIYAGVTAIVTLQDQSGLIDLNSSQAETLTHLFVSCGQLDGQAADAMSDRLLDWREHGVGRRLHGAKAEDYAAAGYSYGPREGPFESVAELKLLLGMTPALYERIAPALTVYSHKWVVNTQVAPVTVLVALPGFTANTIADVLLDRARKHATAAPTGYFGALTGVAVKIAVVIASGGAAVSVETTVLLTGHAAEPFWVLEPVQLKRLPT